MKKKELKNIAKKIVKCEMIIEKSNDKSEIAKAQKEIMRLSNQIESLEDMEIIDEMVLEMLKENS